MRTYLKSHNRNVVLLIMLLGITSAFLRFQTAEASSISINLVNLNNNIEVITQCTGSYPNCPDQIPEHHYVNFSLPSQDALQVLQPKAGEVDITSVNPMYFNLSGVEPLVDVWIGIYEDLNKTILSDVLHISADGKTINYYYSDQAIPDTSNITFTDTQIRTGPIWQYSVILPNNEFLTVNPSGGSGPYAAFINIIHATPEPVTLSLMCIGWAGLVFGRRYKQTKLDQTLIRERLPV